MDWAGIRTIVMLSVLAHCVACPAGIIPAGQGSPGPPARHAAKVKLPEGYRPPPPERLHFKGDDLTVDLYASRFAQGMAVYAEIYPDPARHDSEVTLKKLIFDGRSVPLSQRGWGCRAIFGIHPETVPGMKRLRVEYVANGVVRAQDASLTVFTTAYSFNRKPLDLGKYSDVDYRLSPEDLKFIKKCTVKKARVFSRSGPDLLGGAVSHPRDRHFITSPFWSKRLIKRYRIRKGRKISFGNKTNVHGGTDFRGKKGAPVFAMACGEVAIAEPMYYEGNFVVIDHGNGVFSYYMHLDGITVNEGDRVRAGGLIGRVGSTGLSTASHLHVSLRAQNVYVEPLSILSLPIRE